MTLFMQNHLHTCTSSTDDFNILWLPLMSNFCMPSAVLRISLHHFILTTVFEVRTIAGLLLAPPFGQED